MPRHERVAVNRIAGFVGSRLRAFRKARRLTSTEVSAAAGVDVATISRIEHGKMVGTPESHLRLALALGIRLSTLYRGLEDAVANHPATPDVAERAGHPHTKWSTRQRSRWRPSLPDRFASLSRTMQPMGAGVNGSGRPRKRQALRLTGPPS